MDGLFNGTFGNEATQQPKLIKHQILQVNLSTTGLKAPADASGNAGQSPLALSTTADAGPHFVMSHETSGGDPAFGFEFALYLTGVNPAATAPFAVTVWELIGTSAVQDQSVAVTALWASFATQTGINTAELYHSFDVDATALRFQIADSAADATASRSVIIVFAEI